MSVWSGMAQNGGSSVMGHAPHDSGLSVASSTKEEDVARIRDLEEEVRYLADRANVACEYTHTKSLIGIWGMGDRAGAEVGRERGVRLTWSFSGA